jgi:hypothetical protein
MPGYDRTGPLGDGPRTGRGRGRCGRPVDESTSVEDPYQYWGLGWGYSPWGDGGGRRVRNRNRGRRRGFGRGRRAGEDPAALDATGRQQETFLGRKMDALTAALEKVAGLLSKHAPAEGQDRK